LRKLSSQDGDAFLRHSV